MPKLINIHEVGRLFGVSKSTIERWIQAGKLPKPQRSFGRRRWDYEKLQSMRKSRPRD
ncbi:MAG: MerR family DNA-binding transcriptional regulator [Candidatus Binatia bacterium]